MTGAAPTRARPGVRSPLEQKGESLVGRKRESRPDRRGESPFPRESAPQTRDAAEVRLSQDSKLAYHGLWISVLLLLVIGLCMVLSVSVAEGVSGRDKLVYFRPQAFAALGGLVALLVLSRLDYRRLRGLSLLFAGAVLMLLLLVHIPPFGRSEGGASSWLRIGPVSMQPSEFAKLALVMTGAHFLSLRRSRSHETVSGALPFGLLAAGMCALVLLEGDLGTALIMVGLVLGLLWVGGVGFRQWAAVAGTTLVAASIMIFTSKERTSRILAFLDPWHDPTGAGYQIIQSLVALGRGGWLGVGPGESVQKFQYLPKAHTDMIFSILGEEFGLLGTGVVIVLFLVIALASWRLARRCVDPMGKYLIAGCGMLVTLQAVVNIGGVIGALPLTGVPLPFISYGRSSLLAMLAAVGLILGVARHARAGGLAPGISRYGNVARLDSWGRHRRACGARSGAR